MKYLVFLISIILFSCGSATNNKKEQEPTQEQTATENSEVQSENKVVFNKINNKAKVYMDDSLVFESETILTGYEVDISVDIDLHIAQGAEILRIELYNGTEPYDEQADRKWEIMFDLVLDGEVVDFVNESNDNNKIGLAYQTEYKLEDWFFDSTN